MKGLLLVDKPVGLNSFKLVSALRKRLNVQKVGHSGTLDPFASGLMVMLVGREFTKLSSLFLNQDKSYEGTLSLGASTNTFDTEGEQELASSYIPTLEEVEKVIASFQGKHLQTPPMFSAKKIGGKKLYELARQGIVIDRAPVEVEVDIKILSYDYPYLNISVNCSKGTYIRSLAHDIGIQLKCFAHLSSLRRVRSGLFLLKDAIPYSMIVDTTDPLPFYGHSHIAHLIA